MEKQIAKPLSMLRVDFINNLASLINNSMLPPFIIESILKDVHNEIHVLSQKQLESDISHYQEQLKKADSQSDSEE